MRPFCSAQNKLFCIEGIFKLFAGNEFRLNRSGNLDRCSGGRIAAGRREATRGPGTNGVMVRATVPLGISEAADDAATEAVAEAAKAAKAATA